MNAKKTVAGSLLALLALFSTDALAVPACPEPFEFTQSDGTKIMLRQCGDEFLNWHEDTDGFTVVQNAENRDWYYAELSADSSQLVPSANRVGSRVLSRPAARHLKSPVAVAAVKAAKASRSQSVASGARTIATSGSVRQLVVLVEFSDTKFVHTQSEFDDLFNKIGYNADGNLGSMRDYYREISYGKLDVQSTVVGPVTLPNTYAYYGANSGGSDSGSKIIEMAQAALKILDDGGFDFSVFDADGDGFADELDVIHAGWGEEYTGNQKSNIWSARWYYTSASAYFAKYDGVKFNGFHTEPELRGSDSVAASDCKITQVGVICHEFGHSLGLPDLYDTDYSSEGAGNFCLMAGGSWGAYDGGDQGTCPVTMSAWCKKQLGWIEPTEITASGNYSLPRVEDHDKVYMLRGNLSSQEYFLLENKTATGFGRGLPGTSKGMLIWHVDDSQDNNDDETHYLVDLEEPSLIQHLEDNIYGRGNDADYFRSSTMSSFTSDTTPNNLSYAGAALGLDITSISAPGDTMTFVVTGGTEASAPEAPTGVTATDGTSTEKVSISWNESAGATSYKVYRATSDSSSVATLLASSVSSLAYDDLQAVVGQIYYYWVIACNSAGESDFSVSDAGWRAYAIPEAPTGVTATDGASADCVTITWNASTSATSYSVWRSETGSTEDAKAIASGITATSYADTSAIAGKTYTYWVRATNASGTSGFSGSDTGYRIITPPSAPTGVVAADGLSATEIAISWNAVSDATSYSVWRSTSADSSSASQLVFGLTTTTYVDTSAATGITYTYWVKATNAGGTSGFSAPDTGCLAGSIAVPTSLAASDGTYADKVAVTWAASANATKYELWRGTTDAYAAAVLLASPTSCGYDDSAAQPGMLYYYWVRAVTSSGTSAFSASDTGYRQIAAPTGVAATTGKAEGVTVSWISVTGASSYQIGRGAQGASEPTDTVGTATSLTFLDETAVPGVVYAYFVRAVATACTSAWSVSAAGSREIPTPTGLTASDGTYSDRVRVAWTALAGAKRYELMRAFENDITYAEPIVTTSANSYSDTTAEYGVTYYYFLRAVFDAGTSPWSVAEDGWRAIPVPVNVVATDGAAANRITVSWEAIDGVLFYQVWRYTPSTGRNEMIGTSTSSSYGDNSKSIQPGVLYTYRVKAVFENGTSAFSAPDTGYLKSSSPAVVASDGTSTTQVTLTWSAATGAIRNYLVYRGTSSVAAEAVLLVSTTALAYADTSAAKGVRYYYWVRTQSEIQLGTDYEVSDWGSSDTGYVGLPAVTGIAASDGAYSEKVVVSWSAVAGAVSYEIYRGTSDDSSAAKSVQKGVTDLAWEDTDASPGVRFWYWVRACDGDKGENVGMWGGSDSGYRTLSAPTEVVATTTDSSGVKLTWKGPTSGVRFEILRGDTDDRSQAITVATPEKSPYTDTTAVPGKVYYYWIRVYSDLSESGWSTAVSGYRAVAAPSKIIASDGLSLEYVLVTWTSTTAARRYEIWRATKNNSTYAEQIGTTNKLIWVDATAEPGVPYFYWVKSVSVLDTSAFGSCDSGYVSTPAPTGIAATDGESPKYVRITWTAAEMAKTYAVWRSESADSVGAKVKDRIAATTYDDTSATPGKLYWYWVRPESDAGPGVYAGPDSGYASLSAPTDVTASVNDSAKVNVSWKKSNGATSYEIFRATTNDIAFATNVVLATVTGLTYGDTNAVPAVRYWYWVRARTDIDVSPFAGPGYGYRLLSVPTGVVATDGTLTNGVSVSWNETTGAESYEVWRAENSTATSSAQLLAGVTNALEYLDVTAAPGVTYTYWLKAVCELHTTGFSSYDKGWRSHAAPLTVSASDGTTSLGIAVEWTPVDGAVKYEIWWQKAGVATTNKLYTTTDSLTCVYTNTTAEAGVRYWFWVRTVGASGTGVFSEPDDGYRAVAMPTNLKATDGTSYDYVRVTWDKVAGATSYEVMRSPTNDLKTVTNFTGLATTTFDDTNAVAGVVYRYWVRTVSPLCTSDYAGPDDGYRKLQKISNVIASDGTFLDSVEISWTMPDLTTKCRIWRSLTSTVASATNIATVVGCSAYADTTALHGVKYYYWVNEVSDVEGEMGSPNDGWRGLVVPANVAATDGDSTDHTRITWSQSPDATMYEILRGTSDDLSAMTVIAKLTSVNELLYEDKDGIAGKLYHYTVRAGGTGGWSAAENVDAGYKSLMPPEGVAASDGTVLGKVTVSWGKVTGASHYRVYRAANDLAEKTPLSGWLTSTSYTDATCQGGTKYWYYVVAAVDGSGARPSEASAGDPGYAKTDGGTVEPLDLGGGITWPVTENGDGSVTTNAMTFANLENGKLRFSGIAGENGAKTTVYALVKLSLDSGATVYTTPAELEIVSEGTAELNLNAVWGTKSTLFVIGIGTESGTNLPDGQ